MCYKAPGPRCSSHTWNERVAKGQARAAAYAHKQSVDAEVAAFASKNAGKDLPVDLAHKSDSANNEFAYANSAYLRANKDWHQSPHGLNTLGFQLAEMAGQVSPEKRANYVAAKAQVEDALARIGKVEAEGGTVSAELKAERKVALENYYDTVRDSAVGFYANVAQHMNRNGDKFGVEKGKPQMADKVDVTDINHIKAILDYGTTARGNGEIRNPEGFTRFAHSLSAASAERSYMLSLYKAENKKMSDEPMDEHRSRSADAEATLRRQSNPDTSKVFTDGDMYGDGVKQGKGAKAATVDAKSLETGDSFDFGGTVDFLRSNDGVFSATKI